jgi:hypothetical protein
VLPALEHGHNVPAGAGTDPKPVRFGVVDVSLCLDASEGSDNLPCMFSGRRQLCELMELLELYVIKWTYVKPFGRLWY